jgi:hypothetical protein
MGWIYEKRKAYGVMVDIKKNAGIEKILDQHRDTLCYSKDMALSDGNIFVYVSSTMTEKEDYGSFIPFKQDADGIASNPPRAEIVHKIVEKEKPHLTEEEDYSLQAVSSFCKGNTQHVDRLWIKHSDVY